MSPTFLLHVSIIHVFSIHATCLHYTCLLHLCYMSPLYISPSFMLHVSIIYVSFIPAGCRTMATVAGVDHIRVDSECDKLTGLVQKQRNICKRNVDVMDAVQTGARGAIEECQFQFRNRRWNCSTVDKNSTVFGRLVNTGKKTSHASQFCRALA